MNKKISIFLTIIISIIIISVIAYFYYTKVFIYKISNINIKLNGDDNITINVFDNYEELGASATFVKDDISNLIEIDTNLDTSKIGDYVVNYKVKYNDKENTISRFIKVVDIEKPVITLKGKQTISMYINDQYKEYGAISNDNYDGDLTKNIKIEKNINNKVEGKYQVVYKVKDSSDNISEITRDVIVKKRPSSPGIAVLNYHFFYGNNESCPGHNCMHVDKFESQLKYLKDNNYKTLTMEEFRAWMYNEIDLPKKSVLITIDDGAMGTGFNNGNKLIPLLEKYEVHATLFLISGWWDIKNYKSNYLDIESHSYDMHTENYCQGVSRGAKMLCLNKDEVITDLKKSIEVIGSNTAYCYPFYVYNAQVIEDLKEVGFKLAFAGGNTKATKNSNKYIIPRYQITRDISLDTFASIIE